MGEQSLQGMKELCGQNEYALLYWHLQSNHFPPIDTDFVETAQKALQYARDEDYEQQIEMPNGKTSTLTHRFFEGKKKPVKRIKLTGRLVEIPIETEETTEDF